VTASGDPGLGRDPARLTLGCFLADVAGLHADRVAIVFEGRSISYRELEREARELSRALVGAGVVKGARVAVFMANRPEWVVAAFAVARVGGVLVPVNTFATSDERDYILRHSDASLLLLQRSLLDRDLLAELLDSHPELERGTPGRLRVTALPQLRRIACLGLEGGSGGVENWEELRAYASDVREELVDAACAEVRPADDGVIIYTSGTSDRPKGVLHAQRSPVIQSYRFSDYMGLTPDDRVWTAQPFFWTAGMAMSLGATLAAGARLILQQTFEPGEALDLIESERATALHAWPHQEKALAAHETIDARDLSSLRKIEFSSPLAAAAGLEEDRWGVHASYGASETFTIASALPADAPAETRRRNHGRPLPGMQFRIVDPESGAPVDADSPGEISVKGVTLMRGYYKVEPELYLDDAGFFRSRDGGWIDRDGYLHWTGRLSDLIKTGGANVSPLEIEAALAGLPGIRAGLAVGIAHPSLGEAVILCVLPSAPAAPEEAAIRAHLREKLAAYKVPRRVLFFAEGEMAFTGNQKIQTGPLREAVLQRLRAERAVIAGFEYGDEA
jgi:acyl-CoA synthetase (AMP-forming)/AMP-acid ligase II